jgi:hypothetical protein
MKKFLIVWTILTIILTCLFIRGSIIDVRNRREQMLEISNIKIPAWVETMKKYNNWDGFPELSTENNITIPAIKFLIVFWGIPLTLVSLITLALRKK